MYQLESRYSIVGFAESLIGGRSENQDSCGFCDTPVGALAIVCDGMGGHNGGSTASSLAVQEIVKSFLSATSDQKEEDIIREAITHANKVIINVGAANPDLAGMGTTVTLLLVNDTAAYISHLGDSRVYQIRDGKKVFRTFDHSMVFNLVANGSITEEEARLSPNSNIITAALGIRDHVDVEVAKLAYDKKDRFLLCTDGFWNSVPETKLLKLIRKGKDVSAVLGRAISHIELIAKTEKPNSYDNLTAILVDVNKSSIFRNKMEKRYKWISIILSLLLLCGVTLQLLTPKDKMIIEKAINDQQKAITSSNRADSLYRDFCEFKKKTDILLSDSSILGRTEKSIKSECQHKEFNYIKAREKAEIDSLRAAVSAEKAYTILRKNDSLTM